MLELQNTLLLKNTNDHLSLSGATISHWWKTLPVLMAAIFQGATGRVECDGSCQKQDTSNL